MGSSVLFYWSAFVGLIAGWLAEKYGLSFDLETGSRWRRRVLFFLAALVPVYAVVVGYAIKDYDGHCYAFVGERWSCSFFEHVKNEAAEWLIIGSIFYWLELIFYIVSSGVTRMIIDKKSGAKI